VIQFEQAASVMGAGLDMFWNDRRAEQFDEGCQSGLIPPP
jgi:hypothetical protein